MKRNKFNSSAVPIKIADRKESISVVILADEPAKGMKQFGPKSLLSYNKDIILRHQLAVIKDVLPTAEIVIGVGFEAQKIINLKTTDFRIVENVNWENSTTIETIRLCLNNITRERVLFIAGDCVFNNPELLEMIKSTCIVTNNNATANNIGVIKQDGFVTNFSYGLDEKWLQIFNLGNAEFSHFRKYINNKVNCHNLFHHAIEHIMARGFNVNVINNGTYKIERGYNE